MTTWQQNKTIGKISFFIDLKLSNIQAKSIVQQINRINFDVIILPLDSKNFRLSS